MFLRELWFRVVGYHTYTSAKRDWYPDIAAERPDVAFRPGRPERLGATWRSLARVLGVLELLGTSPHVLLYPSSGVASGRPLALNAGFRCSRTHGEVARCSGTTGPGALRTAPALSFALPRRSFQLFAGPLFRAAPALFFRIAAAPSCATARFSALNRRYLSRPAGGISRAAPARTFAPSLLFADALLRNMPAVFAHRWGYL